MAVRTGRQGRILREKTVLLPVCLILLASVVPHNAAAETPADAGWAYHDVELSGNVGTAPKVPPSGTIAATLPPSRALRFRIIYRSDDEASRAAAAEIAALAPGVAAATTSYMDYTPRERIPVVLRPDTARANGYFTPLPPHIELFISAPSRYQLGAATSSWMELVFAHELIHYLHLTRPRGFFGGASRLFGPLTAAGSVLFMPGWMVEGPTVHGESTLTTGGYSGPGGRGSDPFFEMTWLAPILEDRMYSYDQAGYAAPLPPRGRIYSAGYLMTDYIHRTYGADTWHHVNDTFMNLPFLGMRRALRKATGTRAPNLFREMVMEIELRSAERLSLPEGTPVSPTDISGNWHLVGATAGGVVVWAEGPRFPGGLYLIRREISSAGEAGRAGPVSGQTVPARPHHLFPVTPTDESSVTTDYNLTLAVAAVTVPDYTGAGGRVSFSDLYVIPLTDIAPSGPPRRLTEGRQLLHPALSPDGRRLVAVERQGSYSRLVEVALTDGSVAPLYRPDAARLHTPRFSPDGQLIAVIENVAGRQDILILDAEAGTVRAVVGDPDAGEYDPFFAPARDAAGNYRLIYGSDQPARLVLREAFLPAETLSSSTGPAARYHGSTIMEDRLGAFAGLPAGGEGEVLYATYRSTGFAVRLGSIEKPVDNRSLASSTNSSYHSTAPADAVNPSDSEGSAELVNNLLNTLYRDIPRPVFWLPVVSLRGGSDVETTADFGLYTLAASNLERHQLEATAAWNPTFREATGSVAYTFTPGATSWGLNAGRSFETTDSGEDGEDAAVERARYDASLSVQRPLWYSRGISRHRGLVGGLTGGYSYSDYRPAEADGQQDGQTVTLDAALRLFSRRDGAAGLIFGAGDREFTARATFKPALLDRDRADLATRTGAAIRYWFPGTRLYMTPSAVYTTALRGNAAADAPYRAGSFTPDGRGAVMDTRHAVLGRVAMTVDLGPYDVAWRGLAGSGSALTAYLEQLAVPGDGTIGRPLTPDNHSVAGAEVTTDIHFNTVPFRLTGGVAMRLPHTADAGGTDFQFYLTFGGAAVDQVSGLQE